MPTQRPIGLARLIRTSYAWMLDELEDFYRSNLAELRRVATAIAGDRELGCDAVLMNTGIANAQDPVLMAEAMKHAVLAGRQAYLSGRMPKKLYATASSPLEGVVR